MMDLGRQSMWIELLQLHHKEKKHFNNVNYGILFNLLGKASRAVDLQHPHFISLLDDVNTLGIHNGVAWMEPRYGSNIAHALAKLQCTSGASLQFFDLYFQGNLSWFLDQANPQDISNTVWAHATLSIELSPRIVFAVERNAQLLVREGRPQAVANTMWAFATMGIQCHNLAREVEQKAEWLVKEGTPQDVAITVWAFSTMGIQSPNLARNVERNAQWLIKEGTPQAVSNAIWAFATMGIPVPNLLHEVEQNAKWLVKEGTSQAVSNTMWATATMRSPLPSLVREVERTAHWLVKEGFSQHVANTVWAFATMGFESPNLLREVERKAEWLVTEGTIQEIANIAWAFATQGVESPELFKEIETNAEKIVHAGTPQHLSNLCYSLAVSPSGSNHLSLLQLFWSCALKRSCELVPEALCQLAQTELFTTGHVELTAPGHELRQRMDNAMVDQQYNQVSWFQPEVHQVLTDIGYSFDREVSPTSKLVGGFLAIDLACKKSKIAVEYDGRYHFLRSPVSGEETRAQNGRTKAKRLFLIRQGWTVVSIHYKDWIDAQKIGDEKGWLSKRLEQALSDREDASTAKSKY